MDAEVGYGDLTIEQGVQELILAKTSIMEARYAMAAMLSLQVYEWLSGLDAELRLIHRARWTWIKTLYLLCRYYPLILWMVVMWAYVGNHSYAFAVAAPISPPL
ncbi:hypothetical protein NLJ89_g1894 [Agrocybe chaxingu]|uniref:DUF6533 domain-containing protein n=1 Tax=Agrocybe chaxingu TaxID=84603 RepID=A0A9W8TCP9_9AGAR|nr:hypothetical protein NLJ89_g1894 [Agrocybe chaxingu]